MYTWELLIDYIFPPSLEERLVREATLKDIKNEYFPSSKNGVHYFCNYKRKLIKAIITTAKFSHNRTAIRLLGDLFTLWLTEHTKGDTLLIPIPLHFKRKRERGYNQVTRVLEQLTLPEVVINKNILHRNRNTTPQTKLDKTARTENIIDAFSINITKLKIALTPNIKQVIICDDVYTTGSTLLEAKKILTPHLPKGCELICLAWAH